MTTFSDTFGDAQKALQRVQFKNTEEPVMHIVVPAFICAISRTVGVPPEHQMMMPFLYGAALALSDNDFVMTRKTILTALISGVQADVVCRTLDPVITILPGMK